MNFITGSIVALGVTLLSAASIAADAPPASITSAAPDVKVMTQTENPQAAQQNKKAGAQKAQRPASTITSKPAP